MTKVLNNALLWCCLFVDFVQVYNFVKFENFGFGALRSERVSTFCYTIVNYQPQGQ